MPNNLVLVRHGQSEANVMQQYAKNGDNSLFTDENMVVPDRSWRLTANGAKQAQVAGEWVRENVSGFDRHITSPYIRTRETAANLQLENPRWEENRVVRERSWGEIGSIPRSEFEKRYSQNAKLKKHDPLYWAPPAGESIANVAENRVRNLLGTLHRENSEDNVLVVTHGEFIWATRLVLERWSDEEFMDNDSNKDMRIHNCTVLHYTRINPFTDEIDSKIRWVRRAWPVLDEETGLWSMEVRAWEEINRNYMSNEDLLKLANEQAHRLSDIV